MSQLCFIVNQFYLLLEPQRTEEIFPTITIYIIYVKNFYIARAQNIFFKITLYGPLVIEIPQILEKPQGPRQPTRQPQGILGPAEPSMVLDKLQSQTAHKALKNSQVLKNPSSWKVPRSQVAHHVLENPLFLGKPKCQTAQQVLEKSLGSPGPSVCFKEPF